MERGEGFVEKFAGNPMDNANCKPELGEERWTIKFIRRTML
jgi:hypothetical protein